MTLLDLISEPFGPYPDASILSGDLPKLMRAPNKLELRNVYMKSKGRPTGLDGTEYVATPPRKIPSVQFFGILKIEDLRWLSPQGHEWLQNALRERDEARNSNIKESRLTLSSLYGTLPGTGSKFSVWIYCKKNHQASFLRKEGHFRGDLVFQTQFGTPRPRTVFWSIRSLDIGTASLSRNYLEHWRFFDCIRQLHLSDPSYPLQKRTPKHIMLALKQRFRADAKHHRHDFDPVFDSDVDEEGNTTLPRRPRHLSSAEVYGVMASHAEWFLAQQLATSYTIHTYVNLKKWYEFCLKVKQVKPEKRRLQHETQPWRKWMWGDPYIPPLRKKKLQAQQKQQHSQTGSIDLSRFGTVPGGWEARIEKRCINYEFPDVIDDEGYPGEEQAFEDDGAHGRPMYDSDMSSEDRSAPSGSDSDDSDVDVEWVRAIPRWLMYTPVMRPGQHKWCCPDRDCEYYADLLEMKRSARFSAPEYEFLQSDSLMIGESQVQELLLSVIEEHYHEHLMRIGYNVTSSMTRNMKPKIRIERWQPDGESENGHGNEELNVKEEDMDLS
ncbi:hypothetical protein F5050DRAFT_1810060 [Lentinula boryana]|uniref:Uncharacterized protein n=1 Tax=Lentinula boryana TaxID=40481 RepID=A0ABQ8Q617_9AGAR|nr:hypothetical protein F5050DRAFT_1810060 [Lentinula boryana]